MKNNNYNNYNTVLNRKKQITPNLMLFGSGLHRSFESASILTADTAAGMVGV